MTVASSGTIDLGGKPVHRLGYGAMRITGKGVWGPPDDHDEAVRVLRRAVEPRRHVHRHRRLLRAVRVRGPDPRGAARRHRLRRRRDRHQGRADPARSRRLAAARPSRVPAPVHPDVAAPARRRPHRPVAACTASTRRCRPPSSSARSSRSSTRAWRCRSVCPR
nr:hypothetical protein [Angustibacter aerolatus]